MSEILNCAVTAARAAGTIIMNLYERANVSQKSSNNLLTEADLKAEATIKSIVLSQFPRHTFLAEEGSPSEDTLAQDLWIVDPLDGTNNYAHGVPLSSTSIAYARNGEVVAGVIYDPFRNEIFTVEKGQGSYKNGVRMQVSHRSSLSQALVVTGFFYDRGEMVARTLESLRRLFARNIRDARRTGSAALDCAWTAAGRFDVYFEYKLMPWDYAAGMLMIREAGGCCLDRAGNEQTLSSTGIIAVTPQLKDEVLSIIRWE